MQLYIAGKIAGLSEDSVASKFSRAVTQLKAAGHEVLSPLTVEACSEQTCNGYHGLRRSGVYKHSWECYLRYDIIAMLSQCNGVALLDDWAESPGARFESHVAATLGLIVRPIHTWLVSAAAAAAHKSVGSFVVSDEMIRTNPGSALRRPEDVNIVLGEN